MSKQSRLNKEKAARAKANPQSGSNHNAGQSNQKDANNELTRHPQKKDDRANESRS